MKESNAEKTPFFVSSAPFGVDNVVQKYKGGGCSAFWLLRTGMVVKVQAEFFENPSKNILSVMRGTIGLR